MFVVRPNGSPVFKFREYLGNAEDDISSRILWPGLNIWHVFQALILYS